MEMVIIDHFLGLDGCIVLFVIEALTGCQDPGETEAMLGEKLK